MKRIDLIATAILILAGVPAQAQSETPGLQLRLGSHVLEVAPGHATAQLMSTPVLERLSPRSQRLLGEAWREALPNVLNEAFRRGSDKIQQEITARMDGPSVAPTEPAPPPQKPAPGLLNWRDGDGVWRPIDVDDPNVARLLAMLVRLRGNLLKGPSSPDFSAIIHTITPVSEGAGVWKVRIDAQGQARVRYTRFGVTVELPGRPTLTLQEQEGIKRGVFEVHRQGTGKIMSTITGLMDTRVASHSAELRHQRTAWTFTATEYSGGALHTFSSFAGETLLRASAAAARRLIRPYRDGSFEGHVRRGRIVSQQDGTLRNQEAEHLDLTPFEGKRVRVDDLRWDGGSIPLRLTVLEDPVGDRPGAAGRLRTVRYTFPVERVDPKEEKEED